jgi:hypothetical protein
MNDGRNGIAKLAIRILSIIANSGTSESNFSQFGITHTKLRNKLKVAKVHKSSIVCGDIHRRHTAAGLLPKRGKRKLGDNDTPQDSLAADPDDDEADSDTMFAMLANRLIADANNSGRSDFDNAVTDDRRVPSITSPLQPRAATASAKT